MFDCFADRARKALEYAAEEAKSEGSPGIEMKHLSRGIERAESGNGGGRGRRGGLLPAQPPG